MDILEQAEEPLTAEDLCQILDVRSRSIIYEDLDHVAKTVRGKGKHLLVKPASCGKCLYVFSMKKSSKPPSRCPKCKSEWILAPSFIIRQK